GFEEGDLRFHRNNVRRDRIDESAAEARARIGRLRPPEVGLPPQLDRQKVRPRVEPNHELRALALHGLGEAVGKVGGCDCGHVLSLLSLEDSEGRWTRRRSPAPSSRRGGLGPSLRLIPNSPASNEAKCSEGRWTRRRSPAPS